jgi:putative membrane protein
MDAIIQAFQGSMNTLNAAVQAFIAGFPLFMLHGGVTLFLLLIAVTIYVLLTPHKELQLLRERENASAGLALAGVVLGMAIPLAACLASAVSLYDLVIWAVPILVLQLIAFRFVDLILHDLPRRIRENEAGAAILLVAVKVAVGLITAAAVSG